MERLKKMIQELNMYENSTLEDKESKIIKREILSKLTKSTIFYNVYQTIKEKKLGLNYYLLPYRALNGVGDKIVYELKSIDKFEKDYNKAMYIIETLYRDNEIEEYLYKFLKKNIRLMRKSFEEEFKETKLDKLNIKDKTKYYIYKNKIERFYNEYIDSIGSEYFFEIIKKYNKDSYAKKIEILQKGNKELINILGINDINVIFNENVSDISHINYREGYTLDVLIKEQIYKMVCLKLKNEKESANIIETLLEDVDFIKNNKKLRRKHKSLQEKKETENSRKQ